MNSGKTEAICFSATSSVNITLQLPHTITLSDTDIDFSEIVRNLSFIIDSNLSMKQHTIRTRKAAYIEIRHISSIRQYLTEDGTKTLVSSCILSRLDYCKIPCWQAIHRHSSDLSSKYKIAAKLVLRSRRAEHA